MEGLVEVAGPGRIDGHEGGLGQVAIGKLRMLRRPVGLRERGGRELPLDAEFARQGREPGDELVARGRRSEAEGRGRHGASLVRQPGWLRSAVKRRVSKPAARHTLGGFETPLRGSSTSVVFVGEPVPELDIADRQAVGEQAGQGALSLGGIRPQALDHGCRYRRLARAQLVEDDAAHLPI